jgi:hypothetical protein
VRTNPARCGRASTYAVLGISLGPIQCAPTQCAVRP